MTIKALAILVMAVISVALIIIQPDSYTIYLTMALSSVMSLADGSLLRPTSTESTFFARKLPGDVPEKPAKVPTPEPVIETEKLG
jgi:hypothetical protein